MIEENKMQMHILISNINHFRCIVGIWIFLYVKSVFTSIQTITDLYTYSKEYFWDTCSVNELFCNQEHLS